MMFGYYDTVGSLAFLTWFCMIVAGFLVEPTLGIVIAVLPASLALLVALCYCLWHHKCAWKCELGCNDASAESYTSIA